jgi:uncharacterized protein (TIGR03000 family)
MKCFTTLLLLTWGLFACLTPAAFGQRFRGGMRPSNNFVRPVNTFVRPVNTFVHPNNTFVHTDHRIASNGFRNPYIFHEFNHFGNEFNRFGHEFNRFGFRGLYYPYNYLGYLPYLGLYNSPSYGTYPYYSFPTVYGGSNPGVSIPSLYGSGYYPYGSYGNVYSGSYPSSSYGNGYSGSYPSSSYGSYPGYTYGYPSSDTGAYNYPSNYGNDSMLVDNFYQSPAGSIDPIGGEPTPVTTFLPPAPAEHGVVIVKVPSVDTEVWFDGKKTNNTGVVRVFQTPELPPGKDFTYTVRADWMRDSLPVSLERTVTVRAGKREVVDFMK